MNFALLLKNQNIINYFFANLFANGYLYPINRIQTEDTNVTPKEIKEIYLGLVLLGIPKNHLVQIIEINPNFRNLSKFLLASINMIMLPIVALSPLSIKTGDILCHVQ
jgi:hypothetical protein